MGEYLFKLQRGFFQGGYLTGMTYRTFAVEIGVHESTVCIQLPGGGGDTERI